MNVSFELSSILLGIKVIDLRVILAVNRDLWQLKINQKAYDCHKMDESPWQKDYITLSLWVCWSLSHQFKRTSTFLAFSFPFPFSFSPFFFRDISSVFFNIFFTDVWIFHLIFNDMMLASGIKMFLSWSLETSPFQNLPFQIPTYRT